MKVPDIVGVPLMVIVLADQVAATPAGKPCAPATPLFDIPVAPVVICVMAGLMAVVIQRVGEEEATPAVLPGETMMVPVAATVPQPPVNGIL